MNTVLVLVVYYLSYLSSATDTLGIKTDALRGIFPFEFMPPGVSFMIAWTLIYLLLAVVTMWIRTSSFDSKKYSGILTRLAVSHVLHILWLITNGQQMFVINVIIIFLLWGVLFKMLDILKSQGLNNVKNLSRITFGAYYGWLSIATWTLSVSQFLHLFYPDMVLTNTWMIIALGLGVIVTVLSRLRWRNIFVLLLCLWGLGGAIWSILS